MAADKKHILVVDDDTRLRQLLRSYLHDKGYAVSQAESAAEARQLLELFRFDVMILDVMMPGETGLELAKNLPTRRIQPPPILMLTAMGDSDDRISGLEAGVDDYLTKPFEPRELVLRLENILRRADLKAPTQHIAFGQYHFHLQTSELRSHTGELVSLTEGEAQLLARLSSNPGQSFSREELGELIGSADNTRAVDVQIGRLRKKIEPDTTHPRYIQTVRGMGYKLVL